MFSCPLARIVFHVPTFGKTYFNAYNNPCPEVSGLWRVYILLPLLFEHAPLILQQRPRSVLLFV